MTCVQKNCLRCGKFKSWFLQEGWPDHCLQCISILLSRCAGCSKITDLLQEPRCNKESLVCEQCLTGEIPIHGGSVLVEADPLTGNHKYSSCESDGCQTPEEVAHDEWLRTKRQ